MSVWLRGTLVAVALGAAILPMPRQLVEYAYGRRVYPYLQRGLTSLSNHSSLALFDFLAIIVVVVVVLRWALRLRRAAGRRWRAAALALVDTIVIGAVVYLVFLCFWGFNYRREPLTTRVDFAAERVSASKLVDLTRIAIGELNRLHEPAWRQRWVGADRLSTSSLIEGFARVQRELYAGAAVAPPLATPGWPKKTLLTWYFERSGIDGMTDPFLLEVLVNQTLLPFERPFVLAHEWAHLAGYADESEANFVGWLTCLRGDDQTKYSGWLAIYFQLARDLPQTERKMLASLAAGPQRDVTAVVERHRRANPIVREAAGKVYDRFLKANRVEAGIESYDAVVKLILGTRFGDEWVPVPRTAE